jgi:hypothetical protein
VVQTSDQAQNETRAREHLQAAERNLQKVQSKPLGRAAQDQYDSAQKFVRMAKEALTARNFVFAVYCAEKAATLAAPAGQGLTSIGLLVLLGNLGPLFAQHLELRTRVRIGDELFRALWQKDVVDQVMQIRAKRFAARSKVFRAHPSGDGRAPRSIEITDTARGGGDPVRGGRGVDVSRGAPLPRARESAGTVGTRSSSGPNCVLAIERDGPPLEDRFPVTSRPSDRPRRARDRRTPPRRSNIPSAQPVVVHRHAHADEKFGAVGRATATRVSRPRAPCGQAIEIGHVGVVRLGAKAFEIRASQNHGRRIGQIGYFTRLPSGCDRGVELMSL